MEHLLNCHGEWLWLAQAIAAVPFVGVWLRLRLVHRHGGH